MLYVPFPAPSFPPDVKRTHCRVSEIQGRAVPASGLRRPEPTRGDTGYKRDLPSQTSDTMHHSSLPASPPNLGSHINETLHLSVQVPFWPVLSILAPFATKHTTPRCALRHRLPHQRQPLCLIKPSTPPFAGREKLAKHRRAYDSYYRCAVDEKGDGDAEHGEEMGIIDRAVKGVDDPCWSRMGDEVGARGLGRFRVGLFPNEVVGRIACIDGRFDESFDVFVGLGHNIDSGVLFGELLGCGFLVVVGIVVAESQAGSFHEEVTCIFSELDGKGVDFVELSCCCCSCCHGC